MKKTLISAAIVTAMGVSGAAQAVGVTSMSIADWDGDSIAGGFAFASGTSTTTKYTNFFDSTSSNATGYGTYVTDGGGIIPTGEQGSATQASPNDSFTAGFTFNGYAFLPNSLNAAGSGLTTNPGSGIVSNAVADGDSDLSFSSFTWSGIYGTQMFPLSPTGGAFSTNTLSQGGSCSEAVGGSTACYTLRWEAFINPQAGFSGDTVWQIEGIANFDGAVDLSGGGPAPIPVPAAAWLFGSGLVGLVGVARRRRRNT